MISLPFAALPTALGAPAPAPVQASTLAREEWKLILKALSAYQHHGAFRALYEKLASRHAHL